MGEVTNKGLIKELPVTAPQTTLKVLVAVKQIFSVAFCSVAFCSCNTENNTCMESSISKSSQKLKVKYVHMYGLPSFWYCKKTEKPCSKHSRA